MAKGLPKVEHNSRIVFVDPCKIVDEEGNEIKGQNIPDYTDMCIAFNLYIEQYSRLDNDERNIIGLAFANKQQEVKDHNVSVLGGTMIDPVTNQTYLSTYYTEICANGYKETTQIEGLGVENVQISYDQYYNPTVIIKFVDVRGSALLGREEAINNGEGKINATSIFSAFFTLPYPKFHLQIKGFYGRDVTYQLTVSNFKGQFNATTGNFETTVSFIGYNWALLTDIPLDYLIAAPYCDYVGKEYWNRRITTKAFRTREGEQIPKLNDFFQKIKHAINNADEYIKNSDEFKQINGDSEILQIILAQISKLNEGIEQDGVEDIEEYKNAFNTLTDSIQNFNRDNENKIESVEWLFDNNLSWYTTNTENSTQKSPYKINFDNDKWQNLYKSVKDSEKQIDDEKGKVREVLLKKSIESIGMKPTIHNVFKMLMCHLDTFCHIMFQANQEIENQKQNSLRTPEVLGVSINSNDLPRWWIDKEQNSKVFQLPAWTAVFNEQTGDSNDEQRSYTNAFAWVGKNGNADNWVESKVVWSLQDAIKNTVSQENIPNVSLNEESSINIESILLLPSDIYYNSTNPFKQIASSDVSAVAGLLGIRAIQLFGIMDKDLSASEANKIGVLDAFNFLINGCSASALNSLVNSPNFNSKNMMLMTACLLGDDTDTTQQNLSSETCFYTFENQSCNRLIKNEQKLKDRYPIYSINTNGDYVYVYYYDINNNALVPSSVNEYFNFSNVLLLRGTDNNIECYYDGATSDVRETDEILKIKTETKGWLYSSQDNIKSNANLWKDNTYCGRNRDIYSIITNQDTINSFNTWYKWLTKDQSVKIGEKYVDIKDYVDIIKKYWALDYQNDYKKYYSDGYTYLFFSLKSNNDNNESENNTKAPFSNVNNNKIYERHRNEFQGQLILEENDSLDKVHFKLGDNYNEIKYDDTVIAYNDLYVTRIDYVTPSMQSSVFLSDLYIECGLNEDKNIAKISQAYVFLDAFRLQLSNYYRTYKVNNSKKFSLYRKIDIIWYGGLLYRQEYFNANSKDIIGSNNRYVSNNKIQSLWNVSITDIFEGYDKLLEDEKKALINEFIKFCNSDFDKISRNCNVKFNFDYTLSDWQALVNKIQTKFVNDENKGSLEPSEIYLNDNEGNKKTFSFGSATLFTTISSGRKNTQTTSATTEKLKQFRKTHVEVNDSTTNRQPQHIVTQEVNASQKQNAQTQTTQLNIITVETDSRRYFYQYLNPDSEIQDIFRSLAFDTRVVLKTYTSLKEESILSLTVSQEKYKAYLDGFVSEVSKYKDTIVSAYENTNTVEEEEYDESLLLSMYLYCKNLWDKWLLPLSSNLPINITTKDNKNISINGNEFYNVENFFDNSFTFIDSYYNDKSHDLLLNADKIWQCYIGRSENKNLYSFIGDIVKHHQCSFIAMPDYLNLGMGGIADFESAANAVQTMQQVFTPHPYSAIRAPRMTNNFVVVYLHPGASKLEGNQHHTSDGLDLYSHTDVQEIFGTTTAKETSDGNRPTTLGYNIPSFAVTFGRQDNHIFKDIKLTMDNPVETEESINLLYDAAKKASSGDRRIAFHGQDVYNIFTNYSYQAEVTMMGNAQIQPMMYFQLTNIPMWRGAYVILGVQHTIRPGDMTTTFKGMKLSKTPVPIVSQYWTSMNDVYNKNGNSNNTRDCNENYNTSTTQNITHLEGWKKACDDLAYWFNHNVKDYSQNSKVEVPIFPEPYKNTKVQKDCSGFVWGCVMLYAATVIQNENPENAKLTIDIGNMGTAAYSNNSPQSLAWGKTNYQRIGFEYIPYSKDKLQPYDIIGGRHCEPCPKGCGHLHHAEIYLGDNKSYSWGSAYYYGDGNVFPKESSYLDGKNGENYEYIVRLTDGNSSATYSSDNITIPCNNTSSATTTTDNTNTDSTADSITDNTNTNNTTNTPTAETKKTFNDGNGIEFNKLETNERIKFIFNYLNKTKNINALAACGVIAVMGAYNDFKSIQHGCKKNDINYSGLVISQYTLGRDWTKLNVTAHLGTIAKVFNKDVGKDINNCPYLHYHYMVDGCSLAYFLMMKDLMPVEHECIVFKATTPNNQDNAFNKMLDSTYLAHIVLNGDLRIGKEIKEALDKYAKLVYDVILSRLVK